MLSEKKGFIERMLEQLAKVIAQLVKLEKAKDPAAAERLAEEASVSLFGVEYRLLLTFDAPTVAQLLEHPAKLKALAKLLAAEAQALPAELAARRLLHAADLLEEAKKRSGSPDRDLDETALAVAAQLDVVLPG